LREFSQMFEQMEIPLTSDAMKELFYAINRHASAEITYNQLLNYLREAKSEDEKIRRMKSIQERTKMLAESSNK
jgi:hypothetical protein